MPVVRVDPRGEDPGGKLVSEIEAIEKTGGAVTGVISLFNEHLVIFTAGIFTAGKKKLGDVGSEREVRSDR
jgi:hypothetical protein